MSGQFVACVPRAASVAALFEHPFEPGDLLDGRFRIVREVAQGGMGIVYEAVDEKLQPLKPIVVQVRLMEPPVGMPTEVASR